MTKTVKMLPILKFWLILYNILSAFGWGVVLYRLIDHLIISDGNYSASYKMVGQLLAVVQTCAILEVFHAVIGLVKSSIMTTIIQVSSRLFIVWMILEPFDKPEVIYTNSGEI